MEARQPQQLLSSTLLQLHRCRQTTRQPQKQAAAQQRRWRWTVARVQAVPQALLASARLQHTNPPAAAGSPQQRAPRTLRKSPLLPLQLHP